MTRPRALILLTALTALACWNVFLVDGTPFDGWITVSFSRVIDRQTLPYPPLPTYHPVPGYCGAYDTDRHTNGVVGYAFADWPHWPAPAGDPGLGPRNPPPSHVRRNEMYAVNSTPIFGLLAAGWIAWLAVTATALPHRRHPRSNRPGFDLVT